MTARRRPRTGERFALAAALLACLGTPRGAAKTRGCVSDEEWIGRADAIVEGEVTRVATPAGAERGERDAASVAFVRVARSLKGAPREGEEIAFLYVSHVRAERPALVPERFAAGQRGIVLLRRKDAAWLGRFLAPPEAEAAPWMSVDVDAVQAASPAFRAAVEGLRGRPGSGATAPAAPAGAPPDGVLARFFVAWDESRFGAKGPLQSPFGMRAVMEEAVLRGDPAFEAWRRRRQAKERLPGPRPPDPQGYRPLGLSPDGRILAVARGSAGLDLHRVPGGERIGTVRGTYPLVSAAVSPDGSTVAAGAADGEVHLRWIGTSNSRPSPARHRHPPSALAFSPDGKWLASGSGNGAEAGVKLWNLSADAAGPEMEARRVVLGLAFSPDGAILAGAVAQGILLWNAATGKVIGEVKRDGLQPAALAFSPDGRRLAWGGGRAGQGDWVAPPGIVEVVEIPSGRAVRSFPGHEAPVEWVGFHYLGSLESADASGTAFRWDLRPSTAQPPP